MTKIGYVVETVSSLKILGPVMDEARAQGLWPVAFIPESRKGKPYDTVEAEMLGGATVHIYQPEQLTTAVKGAGISKLCVLNPYRNFANEIPQLAAERVKVFSLDYFVNSIYVSASEDDPEVIARSLTSLAGRFVASSYWQDLEFKVRPEHSQHAEKFVAVGSPLIDSFETTTPAEARKKLGLKSARPIVAVFTPNIRDHQAYFFYGLGTGYRLKRLARLLRDYCDKRDYQLIVKSREKQWDAEPFLAVADVALNDLPGQLYPSTSALLLKASDLALHFGSMMVLEAAGAKVPSIAFAPEKIDKLHKYMRSEPRQLLKDELLIGKPSTLFNFAPVSESCGIGVKPAKFAVLADSMIRSAIDEGAAYDKFNKEFSGWQQGSTASSRIVDHIRGFEPADQHQQSTQLAVAEKISEPI